jgi:hypothetical protein
MRIVNECLKNFRNKSSKKFLFYLSEYLQPLGKTQLGYCFGIATISQGIRAQTAAFALPDPGVQ